MFNRLLYTLRSGKNNKFLYYARAYCRKYLFPDAWCRRRRRSELAQIAARPDRDYIMDRVDYYCRIAAGDFKGGEPWRGELYPVSECPKCNKVYYFDSLEYVRYFPKRLLWHLLPGDITHVPAVPSIVKSRPLAGDVRMSVLFKMDKVRHFIFVSDRKPFAEKQDRVVFRGKIGGRNNRKARRYEFMTKFWGNPLFDLGEIRGRDYNPEWETEKMTISQHLDYKFIMALEGNDVASNLKWVMSSNSLAVMPPPTCESWFMEGRLIPDYHYVAVKPDYSDVEERVAYYIANPDKAQTIIDHAHEWVAQFRDRRREHLILLAVMDRYLRAVNGDF